APGSAWLDVRFDGTAAGIAAQLDRVEQLRQAVDKLEQVEPVVEQLHPVAQVDQAGQAQQHASPSRPPDVASGAPAGVWLAHQAIWDGASPALVAKLSVLPAHFAAVCALIGRAAAAQGLAWQVVLQSVGMGYVRLEGGEQALRTALLLLRGELAGNGDARSGGALVALGCPAAVKRGLDVWGPPGDAQPLMVRIKRRFDPDGTLNPGRFLGGI
ncbi:MAG: FAD-binding oxidoreductase, partial [Acidobacteria bacterium]|nr:FAD-binding oxidoreductase [Acidobacteriota bacterium]